jgi:hypothetical protein
MPGIGQKLLCFKISDNQIRERIKSNIFKFYIMPRYEIINNKN